jgi:1,2-phenylacetyl-CoA epoxidase catalytic subunit
LTEGGSESRDRLIRSLQELWTDAQAVFAPLIGEPTLVASGILPESMETLRQRWLSRIAPRFADLGLPAMPAAPEPDAAGRSLHGADFGWLHGEFTMVADSEPGASW